MTVVIEKMAHEGSIFKQSTLSIAITSLPLASTLVPSPLADSGLEMWCLGYDILPDSFEC